MGFLTLKHSKDWAKGEPADRLLRYVSRPSSTLEPVSERSNRESRPDAVAVTRLSRFMRNARLTLNAVHEPRGLAVALICKDEPIDTRQRGVADMLLAMLATMAKWESERLSEYAKATRQRFIARGRWPGGKALLRPNFQGTWSKLDTKWARLDA